MESDEVKLMPVLQAKTSNWTGPFATVPDATVEIEEKIKKREGKVKHYELFTSSASFLIYLSDLKETEQRNALKQPFVYCLAQNGRGAGGRGEEVLKLSTTEFQSNFQKQCIKVTDHHIA